jgi:hypothetical protein
MKWLNQISSLLPRQTSRRQARRTARRARRFQPLVEALESRLAPANVDVLTWHYDNMLSGYNGQETILTPSNVNVNSFGRLISYPTDGYVYAQPLYLGNFNIAGGTHNVAFVATEHNTVYAFDADNPNAGPGGNGIYWQRSLLIPRAGFTVTTVPSADTGSGDIVPEVGITGTPVIDATRNTLYVLAKTKEVETSGVPHYIHRLYALDTHTGNILRTVVVGDTTNTGDTQIAENNTDIRVTGANTGRIGDTTPPSGPGVQGGEFRFNSRRALHRGALVLAPPDAVHPNGVLYMDFASHGDNGNYRGWVIGYDPSTFQLLQYFLTALDARGAGIWQSGSPVAIDAANNLYFALGNAFGVTTATVGPRNLTESVVSLRTDPATGALVYRDSFTPFNWLALDQADADLGSGGTLLLPDAVGDLLPNGQRRRLIVETGKEGKIYLLDRDDLGGLSPTQAAETARIRDVLVQGVGGVWGSPAFRQTGPNEGLLYYHGSGTDLRAFLIRDGRFVRGSEAGASIARSNLTWAFPGAQPSISSDGLNNAIVWELRSDAYNQRGPEVLYAWSADPVNGRLAPLYNSTQAGARDQLGPATKFVVPVITNGKVFAGTANSLEIFGLFPVATEPPAAPMGLTATADSDTQITLRWVNGTIPQTLVRVERSTNPAFTSPVVFTLPGTATTFQDTGLAPGTLYYYRVRAENNVGASPYSDVASARTRIPAPVVTINNVCSMLIGLQWNSNPAFNDHFEVERSTDGGMSYQRIATLPPTQTTYDDTTVMQRQTYIYRVRAFNTSGETSVSAPVSATVGSTVLDYSGGFPLSGPTGLMLQGTPTPALIIPPGFLNLTTGGDFGQATSAFSTTRVGINAFHSEFVFRLHDGTDPRADGFAFVIQADPRGPAALGPAGGGLGYGPDTAGGPVGGSILNSVAIKFDIYSNSGEGTNSTGIFSGGRGPTVRAPGLPPTPTPLLPDRSVDLQGTPIQLNNQETKRAILDYDGTTLTVRIEVVGEEDTEFVVTSYQVNLPGIIGSDTAFVGFTGGTGGLTVVTDIRSWRFESLATTPGAPSNLSAVLAGSNQVNLNWRCNSFNEDGYQIERSTNGVDFTQIAQVPSSTVRYTDTLPAGTTGVVYYRVRAFNAQGASAFSNVATVLIAPLIINHCDTSPGFTSTSDLVRNGSVQFTAGLLRITNDLSQAGSVYYNQRVPAGAFSTTFVLRDQNLVGSADGITFVLHTDPRGTAALGSAGGALGYGGGAAITPSVAIKFDLYSQGSHNSTTGLYTNGATGAAGQIRMDPTIVLGSGHPIQVDLIYDGTTLRQTVTDLVTMAVFTQNYTVNIPAILGNDAAFVGFTGGTGGESAIQDILTWCYSAAVTRPAAPTNLVADNPNPTQVALTWVDHSSFEDGFIVERSTDGMNFTEIARPGPNVTTYTDTPPSLGTFFYRVRAFNALGVSDPSNVAMSRVGVPSAPRNLFADFFNNPGRVLLSWVDTSSIEEGFRVERSTDGTNFAPIATLGPNVTTYTETPQPGVYYYRVFAFNSFGDSDPSNVAAAAVGSLLINHTDNFADTSDLARNGSVQFTASLVRITDGGGGQAGSFYATSRVPVAVFGVSFVLQDRPVTGSADGLTFVLHNDPRGLTALGDAGGALGYGGGAAITPSVAIKFDLYSQGSHNSTTGLYTNGATGATGQIRMDPTIVLGSNHPIRVILTYDGTRLTEIVTDLVTGGTFMTTYTVNIAAILGTNMAYAGFTGGTGGETAVQDILNWSYIAPSNLPSVPSRLYADPYSIPGAVHLVWTDTSTAEDGFIIERSTNGTSFTEIARTGPNVTTFDDMPAPGVYFYRVRAFNALGTSGPSNVARAVFLIPDAPTDLAAPSTTSTRVNLQWFAPNPFSADGFRIERSVGTPDNFQPIGTVSGFTTQFADTNVMAGNTYYYRVFAFNAYGDSLPSNVLQVRLQVAVAPVAYYSFDEASGTTVTDVSRNNNNGMIQGSVTRVNGVPGLFGGFFGRGLMFNGGSGDQVIVPDSPTLNPRNAISISAWFNAIDWNGNRRIVQKGDNDNQYRLLAEGGVFKFDLSGVGTLTMPLPSTGTWHQVVATYDGSMMRIYLDGTLRASQAASGLINVTSNPLNIGTKVAGATAGDHFNGVLDEVKIYNRALTQDEVALLQIATSQDIGNVATPGSSTIVGTVGTAAATYTVVGSGDDIWNNADAFHFLYTPVAGNARIVAHIPANGITPTDYWAKGVIMFRETLAAGSRDVYLVLTPDNSNPVHNEVSLQWRDFTDGGPGSIDGGPGSAPLPYWIRLTRMGNTFVGEKSADGVNWVLVGTHTIPGTLPEVLYVGLGVTAHNNSGVLNTTRFDNVSITPLAPPPAPPAPPAESALPAPSPSELDLAVIAGALNPTPKANGSAKDVPDAALAPDNPFLPQPTPAANGVGAVFNQPLDELVLDRAPRAGKDVLTEAMDQVFAEDLFGG